ncbi:CLUMA_CG011791, isoform A [Clunio marinus]|uniref:CLUMA_CG011791, isoform A n=1 Tax=Clunio marinus TaxID=568069 RepID=A0A1J1IJ16_9DIPT|nr:CLUMA_CG011791, isoform A [Clunio marinus]
MRVKRSVLRKKDLNAIVVLEDIFSDFRKCHEKCRLCFKSVTEQKSRIKFTNDIKNKIHSVLQIDLSLDGIASKFMCPKCENNLDNFHLFKRRIKEKQKYFEKFTNKNIDDTDDELQILFQQNFIKTENELNISTEMELASPMNKVKEEISEQQHESPSNLDKGRSEETNELQKQDNSNPYFVHGDDHGKVLNNGETTKRHQYVRHLKTKLQCDICGKTLTSRVKIAYHMNTHKKFRKKDFHCEICENSYFGNDQLQRHVLKNHERPKHLSCSICRRTFKTKEDLKNHKLLPCRLPCDICGKMLTQANLKRHIDMVHFNIKPYQCDICGKTMTSRVNIAYHMNTHKKFRKKDFQCHICESSFFQKWNLQRHILKNHEGPKHSTCSICRRTFKTKEGLKNHKLRPCLFLRKT